MNESGLIAVLYPLMVRGPCLHQASIKCQRENADFFRIQYSFGQALWAA